MPAKKYNGPCPDHGDVISSRRDCKWCWSLYMREHHRKNVNKVRERCNRYAATHREETKARWAKWRAENKARQLAYNQQYDKDHPEFAQARRLRRIGRERGAEGFFNHHDWREIQKRQGGRCAACFNEAPLTIDHIVPLARGGSNWPSNLQGLCKSCNSSKGARPMEEFMYDLHAQAA